MVRLRAGIALLCLLAVCIFAETGLTQDRFRVVEIEVEGNRVATRSLILGVARVDLGSPLTPTVVAETIRRLYGLGIFKDVKVEAEEVSGGIKVFIIVDELPKLSGLEFQGNKKFKAKELKEKLGLGVGGYISPFLMADKRQKIYDLYAAEGFFQARITPSLDYNDDSTEAILRYDIEERSKIKVENVVLTGNVRVEADDVIGKMRNRKRGFLRSSDFAQVKYEEDLTKVIGEFHKKGFIDAYMVSDSLSIDTTRNRMTVYLEVYEGPRYYFGKTEFAGTEELKPEQLAKFIKYDEGDIFDIDKYDESIMEIASAYYEIGHLHIQINDQRATRSDSLIDVAYEITEGLPSHVNLVKIIGNHKTKEKVIRRELSVLPGQKFNRSLLIRSVRDAMALNFFEMIDPIPVDLPNGDVDVVFDVKEKQTGQISAGAGYNSQDKVVGTFGMGIPNFRGNGQNLSFNVEFGSSRNSFSVSFTEPWLMGRPTLLGVNLFAMNRNWYDDYTEGRTGGSIRLGRRLRWPDNYFRVFGSYSLERTRFFDFDDAYAANSSYQSTYYYNDPFTAAAADSIMDATTYGPYPGSIIEYNEDWLTASRISLSLVRDSRNLPEFATKGSQISYSIDMTGGILGGFWEYMKHDLTIAKFIPLFWNWALAAKVEYGVVTSPSGDNRILVSDRFTPGGTAYDGVVRGYDDGSLTPDSVVNQSDTTFYYSSPHAIIGVDPPDDTVFTSFTTRVRGKYMLIGNLELQIPIAERQFYGLLFFDAGSTWLHNEDIKPFTGLYKSVGLGFRIVVPAIGTIGFDFGYPFDDAPDQGRGWKPHFQIGTTFR